MSEPELLLDSNIRLWVVLPIVFITFFVGMIRHYVSILLQSDKRLTQEQVSDRSGPGTDALSALSHLLPFPEGAPAAAHTAPLFYSQVLIRSRVLRENGKYIPKQVRRCVGNSGLTVGQPGRGVGPPAAPSLAVPPGLAHCNETCLQSAVLNIWR